MGVIVVGSVCGLGLVVVLSCGVDRGVHSVVASFWVLLGSGCFPCRPDGPVHCVMSSLGHIVSFEALFFRGAGAPLVSLSWGWTLDVSRNTGMRMGMLGEKWWCLPAFLEREKKKKKKKYIRVNILW